MNFEICINKIKNSNNPLFKLFHEDDIDRKKLQKIDSISIQTYLIAMTPRSGSSYFSDLLKNTNQLAEPGEYLNPGFIPDIANAVQANNLSDYWVNLIEKKGSKGIFGVKTSFFHFMPLIETGLDQLFFKENKIIFLRRKNIVKQAISLHLATQSDIFHTNISHSKDKWELLSNIPYDNNLIKNWIDHINFQEKGWDNYLAKKEFIKLYYEDIVENPKNCVNNVIKYLNRTSIDTSSQPESIFKKIGNDKNEEFFQQFINEKSNIEYLSELNLNEERFNS